jgi:hypothetical protein
VVKITKQLAIFKSSIEENKITYVIKYFNLVKLLIKYEIFQASWILDKSQHSL